MTDERGGQFVPLAEHFARQAGDIYGRPAGPGMRADELGVHAFSFVVVLLPDVRERIDDGAEEAHLRDFLA